MRYNKFYGNVIWTNHAITRLQERGLSQERAWETFRFPDTSLQGKKGSTEYQKRYGTTLVTVIAKKNEHGEWIILSCWMDPPLPGTKDARNQEAYREYKHAGPWKRLFLLLKRQLGL